MRTGQIQSQSNRAERWVSSTALAQKISDVAGERKPVFIYSADDTAAGSWPCRLPGAVVLAADLDVALQRIVRTLS
jgi:hypothetical protein